MNLQLFRTTVALLTIGAMTLIPATAQAADTETINSQVTQQKEIDSGGSGFYRAIVVSEKTLQHFTVYRPRNVQYAARREGPLPVFIWFNGACSGDNTGYEHMLNEIASHGYVVVAIGAFKMTDSDAGDSGSDYSQFSTAVNWLVQQEKKDHNGTRPLTTDAEQVLRATLLSANWQHDPTFLGYVEDFLW